MKTRSTTILTVRHQGVVAMGGDGQVTVGSSIMKGDATKIRSLTDGKVLVTRLDLDGLEVSAGSACASGSLEPSHVLRAMGHDETDARAGLRLSVGRSTVLADVRQAVEILRRAL